MYKIIEASSLNLRTGRGKTDRKMEEPICFVCDTCGNERCVGDDTPVYVQISYSVGDQVVELDLCDNCTDLLTDMFRNGETPLRELRTWKLTSRNVRVKKTEEQLHCSKCKKPQSTHLYVKYDNLKRSGESCAYGGRKLCAQCSITYLEGLRETDLSNFGFEMMDFLEAEEVVV